MGGVPGQDASRPRRHGRCRAGPFPRDESPSIGPWVATDGGAVRVTELWREDLLHLIHDNGRYVVTVYDEDADPMDHGFIQGIQLVPPEQVGEVTERPGTTVTGNRRASGRK